jgi:hypothetical protein
MWEIKHDLETLDRSSARAYVLAALECGSLSIWDRNHALQGLQVH